MPPDADANQSMVSPDNTLAEMAVLAAPKQVSFGTPAVGTAIIGQLQSGALTAKSVVQLFNVAVKVTLVPAVIPLTVLAVLSTVPAVLVTAALLAKTIV